MLCSSKQSMDICAAQGNPELTAKMILQQYIMNQCVIIIIMGAQKTQRVGIETSLVLSTNNNIYKTMESEDKINWDFDNILSPALNPLDLKLTPEPNRSRLYSMFRSDRSRYLESPEQSLRLYHTPVSNHLTPAESASQECKSSRYRTWSLSLEEKQRQSSLRKQPIINSKIIFQEENVGNGERLSSMDPLQSKAGSTAKKSNLSQLQISRKERPKEKGLRVLSDHCYEIVRQLKKTNYKQVAARLINDLIKSKQLSLQDSNQEKNIKRRVYDALNVLIALGVLSKEGREIVFSASTASCKNQKRLAELKKQLLQAKDTVDNKRAMLSDLRLKYKKLNLLVSSNRGRFQHAVDDQMKQFKIFFPFLMIAFRNFNKSDLIFSNNQSKIVMRTFYHYDFFGDLDAILQLKQRSE